MWIFQIYNLRVGDWSQISNFGISAFCLYVLLQCTVPYKVLTSRYIVNHESLLVLLLDNFLSWQSLASLLLVFSDCLYFSGIFYSKMTMLHVNIFSLKIISNYCAFGIVSKIWRSSFIFYAKPRNPEIEHGYWKHTTLSSQAFWF